ncbi:hypothetical protein PTKIN_Ptkin09bG0178300 [Pterospermum kingtungense]
MSSMSPDTNITLSLSPGNTKGLVEDLPFLACFRINSEEREFKCFVLNVSNGQIRPISKGFPTAVGSAGVILGSCIYLLGGQCMFRSTYPNRFRPLSLISDNVFYFDSYNLETDWASGCPMLGGRAFPRPAVLDGKIYIFGTSDGSIFAEVFDSSRNTWDPLTPPKQNSIDTTSYPVLADSSGCRILVHDDSTKSLYAYHINDGKWECLDENYGQWYTSVIADGMIYSLSTYPEDVYCFSGTKCSLRVYDVDGKKHMPTKWLCSSEELNVPSCAGLFHLGKDKFCVAWYWTFECRFEYIKFSVSKISGEIHATQELVYRTSDEFGASNCDFEFFQFGE